MCSVPVNPDKPALRRHFRAMRREMDEALRSRADQAINRVIEAFATKESARTIGGDLAFDGEPDIVPGLSRLGASGVDVYLPVIHSEAGRSHLGFRRWSTGGSEDEAARLESNALGINQPQSGEDRQAEDLDIVFMPLVAWDRRGARLGMGAGYYDRALADVSKATRPSRIGVAYDLQRADTVPVTATDVAIHGIITESGLFTFRD